MKPTTTIKNSARALGTEFENKQTTYCLTKSFNSMKTKIILLALLLSGMMSKAQFGVTINSGCDTSINITLRGLLYINYFQTTGGTAPYSYLWSTGDTASGISSLANGVYSVTVTDAYGATTTSVAQVACSNTTSNLYVSLSQGCDSVTKGSISVSSISGGTAPYSFAWSNGSTIQGVSGLSDGVYSVTVTDAAGVTAVATAQVVCAYQNNSNLYVQIGSTCDSAGIANGTALAFAVGGTAPYLYNWSNGDTSQTVTGLLNGNYDVTVTDANGYTATASVVIGICSTVIYQCQANFTWQFDSIDPHTIWIVNNSVGSNQVWNMGDGNYVNGQIASYTYAAPGVYNVCLTAYDLNTGCNNTMCMNLTVTKLSTTIYRVNIINGSAITTGIRNAEKLETKLEIFPNPASSAANMSYELTKNSNVTIDVYDVLGNKVEQLANSYELAGAHKIQFSTDKYQAGVYFIKLLNDGKNNTTRLMVTK